MTIGHEEELYCKAERDDARLRGVASGDAVDQARMWIRGYDTWSQYYREIFGRIFRLLWVHWQRRIVSTGVEITFSEKLFSMRPLR